MTRMRRRLGQLAAAHSRVFRRWQQTAAKLPPEVPDLFTFMRQGPSEAAAPTTLEASSTGPTVYIESYGCQSAVLAELFTYIVRPECRNPSRLRVSSSPLAKQNVNDSEIAMAILRAEGFRQPLSLLGCAPRCSRALRGRIR